MCIPKTIHFTIPEHPSDEQLKNIQIARELHPDWNVMVWQDPIDRSSFVLSKYWDKANSGAQLADLIRLEIVFQYGGFYFDSDFQLLRRLDPLRTYPFVIASQDGLLLPNCFFAAAPYSPVLKHLIDTLDHHEPDWTLSPVYTTGPNFFTREMRWREGITVIPRETFYPYDWNERAKASRLWTYGVHHWDHSWKYAWSSTPRVRQMLRTARHATMENAIKGRRRIYDMLRSFILNKRRQLRVFRPEPYPASGVICAQTLHGPRILLLGEDATITPQIALHGTYEFPEERFVQRIVRLGDWVIDVGANVGIFTLLFAQSVGPFGRVFSYEPNPLPAGLLKKSLVMNWLHDRTEFRQKALGSEIDTRRLRFSRVALGGSTLSERGAAGTFENSMSVLADEEEVDVEVSTLDSDFPVDLPIRLLKIDVEGFEHHVLRGGARLLERQCVDILMLECSQEVYGQNWGEYLQELEKIVGYGYDVYRLNSASKLRPITFRQVMFGDRDKNIILVSKHAKDTIRELS